MQQSLDAQIREHLASYLAGDATLHDFSMWLVPNTWNVHLTGNALADDLTGEIELALAEYSNGDWTEDELRDLLRPLLDPAWAPQSRIA